MSINAPVDQRQGELRSIVVPLDGSRLSSRALELAARLPVRELTLLHVAPEGLTIFPGFPPVDHEAESQDMRAELESLAAPLRTGQRTVEIDIRFGDVADEILDAATDCDLVVMATHGRGAAGRLLFGSTADRISRHSTTPTLLVRVADEAAAVPAPVRIVVPLDGSERGERALPVAVKLARTMSLPLRLIRAAGLDDVRAAIQEERKAGSGNVDRTYEEARQHAEHQASTYLSAIAESLTGPGLEVKASLLRGTPVFALLEAIQPDDLVVMTSHGHRGFQRWMLGSVAEKLIRESTAPVLLVPAREPVTPAERRG